MQNYQVRHTVIGVNELALAISDISPALKVRVGIDHFDMPTLVAALADVARGRVILEELGVFGGYYVNTYGSKAYVILTGRAGLRGYLTGTRYLASNPKVVRIGIGPVSALNATRANIILTLTLYTAQDLVSLIANDGQTLAGLLGNFAYNAVVAGVGAVASLAATAVVGSLTTMALPAIAAGIVAGVSVSVLSNSLNDELQLSANLAAAITSLITRMGYNPERPGSQSSPTPAKPTTVIPPSETPAKSDGRNVPDHKNDGALPPPINEPSDESGRPNPDDVEEPTHDNGSLTDPADPQDNNTTNDAGDGQSGSAGTHNGSDNGSLGNQNDPNRSDGTDGAQDSEPGDHDNQGDVMTVTDYGPDHSPISTTATDLEGTNIIPGNTEQNGSRSSQ